MLSFFKMKNFIDRICDYNQPIKRYIYRNTTKQSWKYITIFNYSKSLISSFNDVLYLFFIIGDYIDWIKIHNILP